MARDNTLRYHYDQMRDHKILGSFMALIQRFEETGDYDSRNKHIYGALSVASNMGLPCGIGSDPLEMIDWPVVFIELPTGQVSWHVPAHTKPWDNHTTEEKNKRVRTYIEKFYVRSTEQG